MQETSRPAAQRHADVVPLKVQNTVVEVIAKSALLILILTFMA